MALVKGRRGGDGDEEHDDLVRPGPRGVSSRPERALAGAPAAPRRLAHAAATLAIASAGACLDFADYLVLHQ